MRRILAALLMAGFALAGPSSATEFRIGDLIVEQAWARATPGKARTGVAYLTLRNRGGHSDRLVSVATPVTRRAALHGTRMRGDVMEMYHIPALELRPGETKVLRPGGLHIMMMGMKRPLRKGELFTMTLRFEKAGSVEVDVHVAGIGARSPGDRHGRGP